MIGALGMILRTPSTTRLLGATTQSWKHLSVSPPAQLSKICTTFAPAWSCFTKCHATASARMLSSSAKPLRVAIAHKLGRPLIARAFTLQHVSRKRPRRPGKADQRFVARQPLTRAPHRLVHRREFLLPDGYVPDQPVIAREGAKDRSPSVLEPDVLTQRKRNHQDVGEQDRGVEIETPDRLEGHLDGQIGRHAHGPKRPCLPANRLIFRKVPAGLTHQPYRGGTDGILFQNRQQT